MILDGVVPMHAGVPSVFSRKFSRRARVLCVNHAIACVDRYKNRIIDSRLSSANVMLDMRKHLLAPVLS